MTKPSLIKIKNAFANAKNQNRAAFIPYISAGYPSLNESVEMAKILLGRADVLEIGLPFSDPLGDGPTIQRANEKALANGASVASTFEVVRRIRDITEKPLMLMTYYNPILATGEQEFVERAVAAGIDGFILPDLPPDEADTLLPIARAAGLGLTFLVAPTSTETRIKIVSDASQGFIYAVAVTGVTGARTGLPTEVPEMLARIKKISDTPVAVGFGVANHETASFVAAVADGVVVASAFIAAHEKGQEILPLLNEIADGCTKK